MKPSEPLYNRKQLTALIIPLVIEQCLNIFVGMADTMMVAAAGEAAVSGVSLVDTVNVLLVVLFTALTSGGAVIISQNLGAKNHTYAQKACGQLLLSSTVLSLVMSGIALLGNKVILAVLFGQTAPDVMRNARIYFFIMAFTYPFLAIYNSCAAMFRSMGNSRISMIASLIMNLANVFGNALLVYGFHLGAAGVGISSLVSRALAAFALLFLLRKPGQVLTLRTYPRHFDIPVIKKLLAIGVPSSVESSIFQVGKILVLSVVAGFGTSATTANAVAGSVTQFSLIPVNAIGIAMITIIGQCVGTNAYDQAVSYTKKMMLFSHGILAVTCGFMFFACPLLIPLYHLTPETFATTRLLVRFHCVCTIFLYPASFVLTNTLRAASDVRYPMVVSIASMWIWRIGFCYILALHFNMGVFGVWAAMMIDWLFHGICFMHRFRQGKWKTLAKV